MSNKETSDKSKLTFKRSTLAGAAALALSATPAYALTLGEAEIASGLNQKFLAEIDLGAITKDELNGLSVRVAPDADYRRANMETGGVESSFSFEIVGQGDDAVVRVTSDRLISEPLVVFLLEARWQRGRLLREYAIFLDPVDPNQEQQFEPRIAEPEVKPQPLPAPVAAPPKPTPTADELERQRLRAPVDAPLHADALPELPYHYGPVQKGVTGIQVATELAEGTVLTPEQMLMALFEVNPVAFHGNVNGLDAGFMLRIPDAIDIAEINSAVAAEEIARHNSAWRRHVANGGNNKVVVAPLSVEEAAEEQRLAAADIDSSEAESDAGDAADETVVEDVVSDEIDDTADTEVAEQETLEDAESDSTEDDRLELVALDAEDDTADSAEVVTSSNPEVAEAQAEAAALRVENQRLREQLSETESLLLDIRALLVARSDELSELKTRIAKLEGRSDDEEEEELEIVTSSTNSDGTAPTQASDGEDGSNGDDADNQSGSAEGKQSDKTSTASAASSGGQPSVGNKDNGGETDLLSTVSNTFNSVVSTLISIGWLVLLPLLLLLLIILLFLARRRKKDDENEEVTASSVDEVAESDTDEVKPEPIYGAPGMEVTTGSADDYGDDFVDELGDEDEEASDSFEQETEDDDFGDFDDELGDDLDDDDLDAFANDDLLGDDVEDVAEETLDELEGAAEDELEDEFDILIPSAAEEPEAVEEEIVDELDVADVELAQAASADAVDVMDDDEGDDDHDDLLSFDETTYQAPEEPSAPVEMEATEDDLDFDLGDFEISEPAPQVDVASDMPSVDIDDDRALGDDPLSGLEEITASTDVADDSLEIPEAVDEDDASALDDLILDSGSADDVLDVADDDFDIAMEEPASDLEAPEEATEAIDDSANQDIVSDAPSDDADADIAAFAGGDQSNTKLDLAKAYIEMGDTDEAKSLLEEVIAETDGAIKAEAESALAELG